MRYTLLDPNRADKYQEDSLALYVYLSNAKEIIEMKRSGFYTLLQSPTGSSRKYRKDGT